MLSEIEALKVTLHGKAPEFLRLNKLNSDPEDVYTIFHFISSYTTLIFQ